jgi:hypothetical protein
MQRCLQISTNHLLLDLESRDDALSMPAMSAVFGKFAATEGSRVRRAYQRARNVHMVQRSTRKAKATLSLRAFNEWKVPFKA